MIVEYNVVDVEQNLVNLVGNIAGIEIQLEPDGSKNKVLDKVGTNEVKQPTQVTTVETKDGHKKEIVLEVTSSKNAQPGSVGDSGQMTTISSDNLDNQAPDIDTSKQYDINSMDNADQIIYNSHSNIFKEGDKGVVKEVQSNYGLSLEFALQLQMSANPVISKNGSWVPASLNEIRQYCTPDKNNIDAYKYQFLDLSMPSGIDEAVLGTFLDNKGILKGQEKVFIEAGKKYNVNEIYLVSHALLETGNGTSTLAQGVNVNGTKVYNMFGIGAVDSNPIGGGSNYAYKAGWDTPEKAIMGGAKFVSEQYINHEMYAQNTLYEMRWNPARPCSHQYATDVAWATKQAVRIEQIYNQFEDANKVFDIPSYR